MAISADILLERIKLKSQVKLWRNIAIFALFFIALSSFLATDSIIVRDHIASIEIKGLIVEDKKRDKKLAALRDNDSIKAVIVNINSPGGTMVGGETIFESLKSISDKKPVVAIMGSMATSGGYMAAIAADYIVAKKGTVTGSIGVILQAAELTELSKKLGVNFITIKSGIQKGSPSPFEKLSPSARGNLQSTINSMHDIFVDMVASRRPIEKKQVKKLANGKVFNGLQALDNKLIDEIGGEVEALEWLAENKNIKDLPVKEEEINRKNNGLLKIMSMIKGDFFLLNGIITQNPVMAIWLPGYASY